MQYVPRLQQPSRLVVPLLAAALGAGLATATFALVNIEDQPEISVPAVVSTAPPSGAVAGERNDGGPTEGAAQQIMKPATVDLQGSKAQGDFRTSYQPAPAAAATATAVPRYDGGPNEGASASAMSSEPQSARPEPYSGMRP